MTGQGEGYRDRCQCSQFDIPSPWHCPVDGLWKPAAALRCEQCTRWLAVYLKVPA
jgi:hypothetical protein